MPSWKSVLRTIPAFRGISEQLFGPERFLVIPFSIAPPPMCPYCEKRGQWRLDRHPREQGRLALRCKHCAFQPIYGALVEVLEDALGRGWARHVAWFCSEHSIPLVDCLEIVSTLQTHQPDEPMKMLRSWLFLQRISEGRAPAGFEHLEGPG